MYVHAYRTLLNQIKECYFLPIQYSKGLTRYHRVLSNAFVMSVLEEYGDLEVIDEVYVQNHLERTEFRELKRMVKEEKFRRYEQPLVERVIRFGKSMGVSYIGLMSVHTSPVRVSASVDLLSRRIDGVWGRAGRGWSLFRF